MLSVVQQEEADERMAGPTNALGGPDDNARRRRVGAQGAVASTAPPRRQTADNVVELRLPPNRRARRRRYRHRRLTRAPPLTVSGRAKRAEGAFHRGPLRSTWEGAWGSWCVGCSDPRGELVERGGDV
jgi:hypothetical protein